MPKPSTEGEGTADWSEHAQTEMFWGDLAMWRIDSCQQLFRDIQIGRKYHPVEGISSSGRKYHPVEGVTSSGRSIIQWKEV